MTVFLVPVGPTRYQLYVEIPAESAAAQEPGEAKGWLARPLRRFRTTLAEAEAERLRRERGETENGSGLWRAVMRKIAEAIAEQRLLWHLRHQTSVELCHPGDLDGPGADREARAEFRKDAARHLRWLAIDGLIAAVTGPAFFFVPGPNIISWYFTFRAIGHFLSWRGARKGLTRIELRPAPNAQLTRVREAIALPPVERRHRLDEISRALSLKYLTGFVERVAAPRA